MKNTQERIIEVINEIYENNDGGLLGFCVREIEDSYSETGNGILYMFRRYPEQAELLEEMLGAISGMNLDDIVDLMERKRDYFDSL